MCYSANIKDASNQTGYSQVKNDHDYVTQNKITRIQKSKYKLNINL